MDFGDTPSTPGADDPAETSSRAGGDEQMSERRPRSRPSAPRRPKKSPIPMIVRVIVVLGGGAAGFFAWQTFSATEVVEAPTLPPVVIPDIPAELLPRMRDMAEAAVIEVVKTCAGARRRWTSRASPLTRGWAAATSVTPFSLGRSKRFGSRSSASSTK